MLQLLIASMSLAAQAAGPADPDGERMTVVVPLSALQPTAVDAVSVPPATHIFQERRVVVVPGDESEVRAIFIVDVLVDEPVLIVLADAALVPTHVQLDGRSVPPGADVDGTRWLVVRGQGRHTIDLGGTVASLGSHLDLDLPAAARSSLAVARPRDATAPDLAVSLEGGISPSPTSLDRIDQVPGALHLTWRPAGPPATRQTVVSADAAVAVAVEAAGIEGRATLRYRVANGYLSEVSFRLPASAEALTVQGNGVAGHTRVGDRVDVQLARPVTGAVTVDVGWRAAPPEGDGSARPIALAWPVANHPTGWATLLRADESLVVPEPGRTLSAVASSAQPEWARDLAPGTVMSTYRVEGESADLAVRMLRYDPVEAPPTLVDDADYEVAYSAHGAVLVRARYQVRNDRSQFLRVSPPPGTTLLGARVAGRVVTVASGDDGALRIPLEKSVETLEGLVSFPVEVLLWGSETTWTRAGTRALVAPAVDAPIATARWEVVLPPGLRARDVHGTPRRVEGWEHGGAVEYGRGWADKDSGVDASMLSTVEEDYRKEQSQETWNQAYRAYQDNRFGDADDLLERSLELNPDNASAHALKGNVTVLLGDDDATASGESEAQVRRIRDMAKAKTGKQQIAQAELQTQADELLRAGNVEDAEEVLEELVEVTRSLAVVEQTETLDQKTALEESGKKLAEVRMKARSIRSSSVSSTIAARVDEPTVQSDDIASKKNEWKAADQAEFIGDGERVADASTRAEPMPVIEAGEMAIIHEKEDRKAILDGLAGLAGGRRSARAPAPPPPSPSAAESPKPVTGPSQLFPAIPDGITASPLTIHVPQGGEVLRFEQQLLPADTPLTVEVRYRTTRRTSRSSQ